MLRLLERDDKTLLVRKREESMKAGPYAQQEERHIDSHDRDDRHRREW